MHPLHHTQLASHMSVRIATLDHKDGPAHHAWVPACEVNSITKPYDQYGNTASPVQPSCLVLDGVHQVRGLDELPHLLLASNKEAATATDATQTCHMVHVTMSTRNHTYSVGGPYPACCHGIDSCPATAPACHLLVPPRIAQ
jgi:hypothetical protein